MKKAILFTKINTKYPGLGFTVKRFSLLTRKELYALIKAYKEEYAGAKEFFGNHTTKSTVELSKLTYQFTKTNL